MRPIQQMTAQELALRFVEDRGEESFRAVYERLKPGVIKYVQRYLAAQDSIDEVVAITFAKAYARVAQYDRFYNFSTWVYAIARHESLIELRRQRAPGGRTIEELESGTLAIKPRDLSDFYPDPEFGDERPESEEIDQLYDRAINAIHGLPEKYRQVLVEREVNHRKYDEIAQLFGIPINTVKTRIRQGRWLVRTQISKPAAESAMTEGMRAA